MWLFFLVHFIFYSIACALRIIAIIKSKTREREEKKNSQIQIQNGNRASTIPNTKRLTGTTKAFIYSAVFFLLSLVIFFYLKVQKKFCFGLELNNFVLNEQTHDFIMNCCCSGISLCLKFDFSEMNLRAKIVYHKMCCNSLQNNSFRFGFKVSISGILFI